MTPLRIFLTLVSILTFLFADLNAQDQALTGKAKKAREVFNKATQYYYRKQFDLAIMGLKKSIELDSTYAEPYMLMASIYELEDEYEQQEKTLLTLNKKNPSYSGAYYTLGRIYLEDGRYKESEEKLENYLKLEQSDEKFIKLAKEKLKISKFGIKMKANPVDFDPVNVGPNINTKMGEYWPCLTADKAIMYFTRRNEYIHTQPDGRQTKRYREDIYQSEKDANDKWTKAVKPPGDLNSDQNEGAISISPDGTFMILTGCNWPDGYGSCDLYISYFRNGQWSKPENLGPSVNTEAKETQPSISFDGRTVYFSSNRKGTVGGLDLWRTVRMSDGNWSVPQNLGNVINTEENEQSPFIHPDNQTLYFSSRGHTGMGQSDLFVAKRQASGRFGDVRNMGYPINDHTNQISLFVTSDGKDGYIASEADGYGSLDIFTFKMPEDVKPEPVTYVKGKIVDKKTGKKIEADYELLDLESGDVSIKSRSDGKSGEFRAPVSKGKDYALNVSKKGYMLHSEHLNLSDYDGDEPFEFNVDLKEIKVGETSVLNNIFFEFDSYKLKERSIAELKKLIEFLNQNPNVKIELAGHTDNVGSKAYNIDLSNNRAKEVQKYLIKQGIDAGRLEYKGYGEEQPIKSNSTAEGRAKNRRTEFKIIGM